MISGRTLASRFEHNASVRYRVNMFIELQLSFRYDTASRHWAVLDLNALFRNTLEEPITRHSPLECTPMKHDFASKNSETHLKLVT